MAPKTNGSCTGSSSGGGGDPVSTNATDTTSSSSYPSSSYASTALALMSQDWSELSLGDDPVTAATSDLDRIVDRVTALLLIRIVAIVAERQDTSAMSAVPADNNSNPTTTTFPDLSTSTICRHVLLKRSRMKKEKQRAVAAAAQAAASSVSSSADGSTSAPLSSCWPKDISTQLVDQLKEFVKRMLKGYKDVPYHSCEHAYHVIVSTNKLLDIMICPSTGTTATNSTDKNKSSSSSSTTTNRLQMQLHQHLQQHSGPTSSLTGDPTAMQQHSSLSPPTTVTFGLRNNALALFSLVFAALVHDVEHQGIPNRQLAMEDDRLAILYNDQSIAENWSLYVAFSEFLQDEFTLLRQIIFGGGSLLGSEQHDGESQPQNQDDNKSEMLLRNQQHQAKENYRIFRKHVVNLVLHTDIASPERTQVGKSKWKEAFGEPHETVEAKVRHRLRQQQQQSQSSQQQQSNNSNKPPIPTTTKTRRLTNESAYSEITFTPGDDAAPPGGAPGVPPMCSPPNASFRKKLGTSGSSSDNNNKPRRPSSSSFSGDDEDEGEDDDSMSGTPDISFHDGAGAGNETADQAHATTTTPTATTTTLSKLAKHLSTPQAQAASAEQLSELMLSAHSSTLQKFGRRMSNSSQISGRYRQRLGILRTVDLSGETLETYSRHGSINNAASSTTTTTPSPGGGVIEYNFSSNGSIATAVTSALNCGPYADNNNDNNSNRYQPNHREADEPDELRMSVVMETIMTAADVAHNLQGWGQMAKWSGRLYQELRKAHVAGRGPDVSAHWFENQIGFLESYLLPLARRLEDTGVFGEEMGSRFAHIVEENRDKWLTEGYDLTVQTIAEGAKRFPMNGGSGQG